MVRGNRLGAWMRFAVAVTTAFLIAGSSAPGRVGAAWQEPPAGQDAAVRIVHGIADAGPLDVYINGSIALIGIVFAESSGDLILPAGEHAFAVVPTGAPPDDAIAQGTIDLQSQTRYYAPLLGTVDAASVGLFAVDGRPLEAGRARFRIISGVPDAGEMVPIFSGGDALSEPLAFGDASAYAAIEAGAFDFELLDAVTGTPLLALPQTPMAEGATTDVVVIGQIGDATIQALVLPIAVNVARPLGQTAAILAGTCTELGAVAAEIGVLQTGQGEPVGVPDTLPVAQGFGLAAVPFASLVAAPHSLALFETDPAANTAIACGEIGGAVTDTGALVIAIQSADGAALAGIAVLAPGLEDPDTTGVSIFVTASAATPDVAATPVPSGG